MNILNFSKENNAFLLLLSLCMLLNASCKKTIELDENYLSSRLVLNSIFGLEDDSLNIFVTKTRRISHSTPYFEKVDDAKILLLKEEKPVGEFKLNNVKWHDESWSVYEQNSTYGSRYTLPKAVLDASSTYSIQLSHPQLGASSAKTNFAPKVPIESVELVERTALVWGEMKDLLVAEITFTDPPGETNYYQIAGGYIEAAYKDYWDGSYEVSEDTLRLWRIDLPYTIDQIDPLIKPNENDIFNYSENQFQVFSDELIDGKTYTLSYVVYEGKNVLDLDTAAGEYFKAHVEIRCIPRDLYLYYVSLETFYWNEDALFTEPVQVFSNVENGTGIVAGYRLTEAEGIYGEDNKPGKTYMLW